MTTVIERMKELFYVDPCGEVRHRINRIAGANYRIVAGSLAGHLNGKYRVVALDGKAWKASHVSYAIANGHLPMHCIDHIDGNPLNNRPDNLRDVTYLTNNQNKKVHRNGKLPGASVHTATGRWQARGWANGKQKFIGLFESEEMAHAAYKRFLSESRKELDT